MAGPSSRSSGVLRFGGALSHRSYRLFFAGQSISLVGEALTRFATVWMVYRLTRSPVMLGLVGFFGQAPAAVLSPVAGVLVDRWNRQRTVIVTQVAAMLQSAALAFFALTGRMTVRHLLVLGAVQAVINAFDTVARQSFLGEMIEDRADLPNAVALNSLMKNSSRMLGPLIAAVLVPLVGEGWCFTIDAASSLAVIGSLAAMHVALRPIPPRAGRGLSEMKEGLAYVAREPVVRAVLLLFTGTSMLAGSYATLLPLIAGDTLHGGPQTLGILTGAAGFGALTGALMLARRTSRGASQKAMDLRTPLVANVGLGCALMLLELARSTWIAAPLLFMVGASLMVQSTSSITILQTTVDRDRMGRVMSLYAMGFFGGAPIGALLEGELAKVVGPVHMFAIAGASCLVGALMFARAVRGMRAAHVDVVAASCSPTTSPT